MCFDFGFDDLGLFEYDHDGSKAIALERAVGIKVIRHSKCLLVVLNLLISIITLILCCF